MSVYDGLGLILVHQCSFCVCDELCTLYSFELEKTSSGNFMSIHMFKRTLFLIILSCVYSNQLFQDWTESK